MKPSAEQDRTRPVLNCRRTPAEITRDAEQRFQTPAKKSNPRLAPVIGPSPI